MGLVVEVDEERSALCCLRTMPRKRSSRFAIAFVQAELFLPSLFSR